MYIIYIYINIHICIIMYENLGHPEDARAVGVRPELLEACHQLRVCQHLSYSLSHKVY